MNKPRPSALPLKKAVRVSPPTAPGGFFSFSSFRVKKGQSKGDATSSSESSSSNRRRTASGDGEHKNNFSSDFYSDYSSSSTSWAAAVVSPLASQKFFNPNSNENGCRLSTFKSFTAESAPCSPYAAPEYRFLNESANFPPPPTRQTFSTENYNGQRESIALGNDHGCGGPVVGVGAPSEMHKGYYDHKNGPNHSLADTNELHGKPPSGVIRHHPLRSNSEPHGGGHYYGGQSNNATDLGVIGPPPPAPQNHHHHHHGLSSSTTANVYASHHIVLEDQGIDMSQSPGHESPSSTVSSNTISVSGGSGVSSSVGSSGGSAGSGSTGCRHSAASFDSGRASSSLYQQGVRYSGLSSESSSTGSCRHSYHSSSSSLGSIPPEEICNFDVSSMIAQGLPDTEILNAWLTGVHFECYYQNFIQAGYDMQTIVKMTPEDLNAIGITKPNHRKRLKSEISQLIIPDGLPDYIPNTIEEWLRALRMEEYTEKLKAQGYTNVRQVTNIMWEDLEEIGILKLGHQKKFLLAIKRVEDIMSGKRLHTTSGPQNPYHPAMDVYAVPQRQNSQPLPNTASQMPYHNQGSASQPLHGPASRAYMNSFHQQQKGFPSQQSVPPFGTWRQHSLGNSEGHYASYNPHAESLYGTTTQNNTSSDKTSPHLQLLTHQPQIHPEKPPPAQNGLLQQPEYHPEVIAIHVKGDRRPAAITTDHCGEPIYGTSSFQAPPPGSAPPSSSVSAFRNNASQPGGGKWMDDGETTPTNEADGRHASYPMESVSSAASSFGTLPRLMKNKTLAKTGSVGGTVGGLPNDPTSQSGTGLDITYHDQLQWQEQQQQQLHQSTMDGYKSLPKNMGRFQNSTFRGNPNAVPGGGRQPPPPPRRSSSTNQDTSTFSTFHPAASATMKRQSSWSNCSSGDDSDLPAPPPPEDLALISGPSGVNGGDAASSVPTPASHYHHLSNNTNSKMNTSSSTSLTASSSTSNNAAASSASSTTNLSTDYHHNHHNNQYHPSSSSSYASNSSTNAVASSSTSSYNNNCSSNSSSASSSRSIHHPSTTANTGRLRDPSPGAESDLSTTFATVGVRRNGSDASFKSSSSTESESIPFANDNAGTIKQQKPGSRSATGTGTALESIYGTTGASANNTGEHIEAGDVLSDIGNMLADLTDELDAILQQEMDSLNKR